MIGAEIIEPVPWWIYVIGVTVLMIVGYAVRLLVLGYRQIRLGQVIPRVTVDMLLASKNDELQRALAENDKLWALVHIKDAANTELAQSVESLTDVVETNNALIQSLPRVADGGANARRRQGTS